jgi:hypothetical protein
MRAWNCGNARVDFFSCLAISILSMFVAIDSYSPNVGVFNGSFAALILISSGVVLPPIALVKYFRAYRELGARKYFYFICYLPILLMSTGGCAWVYVWLLHDIYGLNLG